MIVTSMHRLVLAILILKISMTAKVFAIDRIQGKKKLSHKFYYVSPLCFTELCPIIVIVNTTIDIIQVLYNYS